MLALVLPLATGLVAQGARSRCQPMMVSNTNEFARPANVASVDRRSRRTGIAATPDECAALAKRFELESIGSLEANVSLALVDKSKTRVRASGKLSASDVVRVGASGEAATLQAQDVEFETFFQPEEGIELGRLDSTDAEAYDEAISADGQIDMGELVAQHLYVYIHDLALEEQREWDTALESDSTLYYDSDPGAD